LAFWQGKQKRDPHPAVYLYLILNSGRIPGKARRMPDFHMDNQPGARISYRSLKAAE